jgi:hypothetical protein
LGGFPVMKCPQICSKQRRRGTLLSDKLLAHLSHHRYRHA